MQQRIHQNHATRYKAQTLVLHVICNIVKLMKARDEIRDLVAEREDANSYAETPKMKNTATEIIDYRRREGNSLCQSSLKYKSPDIFVWT